MISFRGNLVVGLQKIFYCIFKYSHFVDNGIEIDELQTLLEPEWKDVLDSLIPVPGHRMKFVKNLKIMIKEKSEVSIEVHH